MRGRGEKAAVGRAPALPFPRGSQSPRLPPPSARTWHLSFCPGGGRVLSVFCACVWGGVRAGAPSFGSSERTRFTSFRPRCRLRNSPPFRHDLSASPCRPLTRRGDITVCTVSRHRRRHVVQPSRSAAEHGGGRQGSRLAGESAGLMLGTLVLEREACCFCRGPGDRPGGEGVSVCLASADCAGAPRGRKRQGGGKEERTCWAQRGHVLPAPPPPWPGGRAKGPLEGSYGVTTINKNS